MEAMQSQTYHLISQHDHGLDREFATAEVEQVLQARPQKINHHDIVFPLDAIPPQVGDTGCRRSKEIQTSVVAASRVVPRTSPLQNLVELGLVQKLWVPCFNGLLCETWAKSVFRRFEKQEWPFE